MTLPANLNVYLSAALFVLGAYVLALYVGLLVWTARDVHARTRDVLGQIMAVLLVAVFTLPGLLVYMLLRSHTTVADEYERSLAEESLLQDLEERRVCPECHRRTEPDFLVCPHCRHELHVRCGHCDRLLRPSWELCPYCGVARGALGESDGLARVPSGTATRDAPTNAAEAVAPETHSVLSAQRDGPAA